MRFQQSFVLQVVKRSLTLIPRPVGVLLAPLLSLWLSINSAAVASWSMSL